MSKAKRIFHLAQEVALSYDLLNARRFGSGDVYTREVIDHLKFRVIQEFGPRVTNQFLSQANRQSVDFWIEDEQTLMELSADTKSETKAEDLNACVERSLDLLRYELAATGTTVVRQLAVDLPLVRMDRGKLEQVFINLFINALHAMSQDGTLTVATRVLQWSEDIASREAIFRQFKPGDTLAVTEVRDTGTGIPEALLPRVFDPFFTTKPVGHGTGLGLAVVKRIVDLHGGAIDIRNAPPGGARVTLILKLDPEEPPWTGSAF